MNYRTIKDTDLKPSAICLGGGPLGSSIKKDEAFMLLDAFYEFGGNFIDTAKVYADWIPGERSVSEKTIGSWMKERKNRTEIIIGTKGAHPDLGAMNISRLSRQEIVSDLESSLASLQTDYIDLYWLHRDDESRPVEDILYTLDEQVKKGNIKYFGCSNWKPCRIREALEYSKKYGLKCFVGNQMMWSLAVINKEKVTDKTLVLMDDETMELHKSTGLAAIPYSSQAKGYFTKLDEIGLKAAELASMKVYNNQENLDIFERIRRIASDMGRSINEIALAYLTSHPFTTIPVAGCKTREQLKESVKAADLVLEESVGEYIKNGKM